MQDNKFVLVMGLGQTGLSCLRFLKTKQQACWAFDTRIHPPGMDMIKQEFPELGIFLGNTFPPLAQVDQIVISPGISQQHPLLQQAKAKGISIIGDVELFARHVHAPVVAITGTNGKSTVTSLVGKMAQRAGLRVSVAGNIGEAVLSSLLRYPDTELWVLELSSFQLETVVSLRPSVSVLLNISPDHLDRYDSFAHYIETKHRVFNHAKVLVYCKDDPLTRPAKLTSHSVSYTLAAPVSNEWGIVQQQGHDYLAKGEDNYLDVSELKLKGKHNWGNALASLAVGDALGLQRQAMLAVLREFGGLAHRCQWVRTCQQVHWYNDSKGTNVGATLSAIEGLGQSSPGKIILIAGGQAKDASFSDLIAPIRHYVRSLVLFGEDAEKMALELAASAPITQASSLEQAINVAKNVAQPGDTVLLSPACASFDMFDNYAERGEIFTQMVHGLHQGRD